MAVRVAVTCQAIQLWLSVQQEELQVDNQGRGISHDLAGYHNSVLTQIYHFGLVIVVLRALIHVTTMK